MLRRVSALAATVVCVCAQAHAGDLITFPKVAADSIALKPFPLATLKIDWLGAFASEGAARPVLVGAQFEDFLTGAPVNGGATALAGLAGLTDDLNPPPTNQRDSDGLVPFDF